MDYKIEKNIPIPEKVHSGKWKNLAEKMKFGDSVLIPKGTNPNSLRNAIDRLNEAKAVSRKVEKGTRVWKVPNNHKEGE